MDNLSLDEIFYITRFLGLKNTFNFIKSIRLDQSYNIPKSILVKNKKLMVIENIYNEYFSCDKLVELKELLEFFYKDIDLEDLICFMANVYPNNPRLRDTILFDLLKLYEDQVVDGSLLKAHFKFDKKDLCNK
jgi:hypothetical protein